MAQGVLGRIQPPKVRSAAEGRGGEADNGRLPSLRQRRQGEGDQGGVRQAGRESERGGGHHEVCGTSRLLALALAGHHSKWSTMWVCRQPHSRGVPQWCPPLGGFVRDKDPPPQNLCWWSCEANVWDAQLKQMANTYLDVLRSMFANDWSVIAATAGIPAMPAFISAAGQPMNESMVSKRIIAMGKKLKPDLPGNRHGSRLRKGIVTLQRTDEAPTVSPGTLAKQMSHSVATAQTYYYVEEEAQSDTRVASYLKSLFQPKEVT